MKEKQKQYQKQWIEKNRNHWNEYMRERRKKNPNSYLIYNRKYMKKYREERSEEYNQYYREYVNNRRKSDSKFRINRNVQSAIYACLKRIKGGRKWETLVDYTVGDLMNHLEAQFDENMFWHNYGSYWHVDHIKPVSLFNFKTAEDKEFKECWALENLQPLEARANLRKYNHYPPKGETIKQTVKV